MEKISADYPRPQLQRENWTSLDGPWDFLFDDETRYCHPREIEFWTHKIEVPFAPESERSGIHDRNFHHCCWYQRTVAFTAQQGKRVLLHFGAVDYEAQVWVNDQFVGTHHGGHSRFSFDITAALNPSSEQKISVRAYDDPHDLAKPRGKQDWQLEPHSIWYPRTSGIWQTVWLEEVPETYIQRLRWTPHLEGWEVGCEVFLNQEPAPGMKVNIQLFANGHILANDSYLILKADLYRRLALSDPGIDDYRNELLWSPERPTLLYAKVVLSQDEQVIDTVHSYTALRSVGLQRDYFLLNGRPYYMRLVLDQGYWPDTLMTAPSTEALKRDIELAKQMGFNGARKHQKVEDPRYLYWADRLGFLVWQEMPSPYRFTTTAVERTMREWSEIISQDFSHPSIVVWVPFNESWGVPDLAEKVVHRNCVQAFYYLTKTLDPTRPVIGNDGWESVATDIIGIHDYDKDPENLRARYNIEKIHELIKNRIPAAGRLMTLEDYEHRGQPLVLSEFGGIAYAKNASSKAWGYTTCRTPEEFKNRYVKLLETVRECKVFSGFCYTQFTDTFQEVNGLLYADRTPKIPLEEIRRVTSCRAFTVEGVASFDFPFSHPQVDL